MTPETLVSDVAEHFLTYSQWPLVRTLQSAYGPKTSVRAVAASLGPKTIVCQEGADGACFLTLDALSRIPKAAAILDTLAKAIGFLGRHYESDGTQAVHHDLLARELALRPDDVKKLGSLLYQVSRLWSGGSWSNDRSTYHVNPSEDASFFRDVSTFPEYLEARAQLDRNDRALTEALSANYRRLQGDPTSDPAKEQPSVYRLTDPGLDALFQRDLQELSDVHSLGAWKATAILAGCCLEALLLDICQKYENDCATKWGSEWRRSVQASDMARYAATKKWISQDHGDSSRILRRWRNVAHPAAALQAKYPTKELADALVALLRLLLAELGS